MFFSFALYSTSRLSRWVYRVLYKILRDFHVFLQSWKIPLHFKWCTDCDLLIIKTRISHKFSKGCQLKQDFVYQTWPKWKRSTLSAYGIMNFITKLILLASKTGGLWFYDHYTEKYSSAIKPTIHEDFRIARILLRAGFLMLDKRYI